MFPPDSPTLKDAAQYEPLSEMKVVMQIDVAGPFANDMVELKAFELRFQLVPEPSGMALSWFALVWATRARQRRLRRNFICVAQAGTPTS